MKKIITNLPLLATLVIASIMMLSQAYGQSAAAIADLVKQDAAQNAEVVPTSTTDDEDNSGSNSWWFASHLLYGADMVVSHTYLSRVTPDRYVNLCQVLLIAFSPTVSE